MGRRVSDGNSFNAAAPGGQVIYDYDLFRIGGWNGVAIGEKDGSQTDRTLAFECDPAAIYEILVPNALDPDVGDFLYWKTNDSSTFQRGDADLVAASGEDPHEQPCFIVSKTKNANDYLQGRVLQSWTNLVS